MKIMKRVPQISVAEAAAMVKNGDVLMVGGFGMTGNPAAMRFSRMSGVFPTVSTTSG